MWHVPVKRGTAQTSNMLVMPSMYVSIKDCEHMFHDHTCLILNLKHVYIDYIISFTHTHSEKIL